MRLPLKLKQPSARNTAVAVGARMLVLASGVLLGACTAVTGGGPAPTTYDLSAVSSFSGGIGGSGAHLVVMKPRALTALDTERILVRQDGALISYFTGSQWSDQLSNLVRARLTQAFENTGKIRAVGQQGDGLRADYILVTEIRQFELNADDGQNAEVAMFVKIINDRNGRVVSSRLFDASAAVGSDDTDAVVAALDDAFAEVQDDIVRWTFRRI